MAKGFDDVKKALEKTQKVASHKRDCARDKEVMQKQVELVQKDIEKLKKNIKKIEKKMDEDREVLLTKCNNADFLKLKKLLHDLPKQEEVDEQREHVNATIKKFNAENKSFKNEMLRQSKILRRFDEVISEKTNKVSLQSEVKAQTENFQAQIDRINVELVNFVALQGEHRGQLKDIKLTLEEQIDLRIVKHIKKERQVAQAQK